MVNTALLDCLSSVENTLLAREKLEATLLAERRNVLESLQKRLEKLKLDQAETEKDLQTSVQDEMFGDTELLPLQEKRKLLRIWSRLVLAEPQKVGGDWRFFVGKYACSDIPNDNWALVKLGINELRNTIE